jgi:hypothetical protein
MMERERKLGTVNERMQSDYSYELVAMKECG